MEVTTAPVETSTPVEVTTPTMVNSAELTSPTTMPSIMVSGQKQQKTGIIGSDDTNTVVSTKKHPSKTQKYFDDFVDQRQFKLRQTNIGMIDNYEWIFTSIFTIFSIVTVIVLILAVMKIMHSSNRNFGNI